MFIVTDRNDADRKDPIIDQFPTREAAEAFAAQWSADNDGATCAVEEWASIEDARG
jgi:hypothetical protein